jgi:hypothetical protein
MVNDRSGENFVTTHKTTGRRKPEDHDRHFHRRENIKFQIHDGWFPITIRFRISLEKAKNTEA